MQEVPWKHSPHPWAHTQTGGLWETDETMAQHLSPGAGTTSVAYQGKLGTMQRWCITCKNERKREDVSWEISNGRLMLNQSSTEKLLATAKVYRLLVCACVHSHLIPCFLLQVHSDTNFVTWQPPFATAISIATFGTCILSVLSNISY